MAAPSEPAGGRRPGEETVEELLARLVTWLPQDQAEAQDAMVGLTRAAAQLRAMINGHYLAADRASGVLARVHRLIGTIVQLRLPPAPPAEASGARPGEAEPSRMPQDASVEVGVMDESTQKDGPAPRPSGGPEGRVQEPGAARQTERSIVVSCFHCGVDTSRVGLATGVATPQGAVVQIFYPMRCPECNHPQVQAPSPILPAGSLPRPHLA